MLKQIAPPHLRRILKIAYPLPAAGDERLDKLVKELGEVLAELPSKEPAKSSRPCAQ